MASSSEELYSQSQNLVDVVSEFVTKKFDNESEKNKIIKQIHFLQSLLVDNNSKNEVENDTNLKGKNMNVQSSNHINIILDKDVDDINFEKF